jgi:microcin C transport system permease protein
MHGKFWRRFCNNRPALVASCVFVLIFVGALGAPFVANDRPLVMRYKGEMFFPVLFDYLPQRFGQEGFVADYFVYEQTILGEGDWMIFPPIKQRPYEQNLNFDSLPAPPGSSSEVESGGAKLLFHHALGTDTGGRDLITRLIYGCQTSLVMAVAITFLSMLIGVLLGAVMGYIGGSFDLLVGRLLETIGYFPVIFMIIILVAFLEQPSMWTVAVIFAVLGIDVFAFYMRGQVLQARKLTFVEAAQAIGQRPLAILLKHILPNSFTPILVLIPFTVTANISFLASIDFLGFGVQPPTASLGAILRAGYDDVANRWWLVATAAVVLVTILLLVNLMGDGVRDGLDPHTNLTRRDYRRLLKQHGDTSKSRLELVQ